MLPRQSQLLATSEGLGGDKVMVVDNQKKGLPKTRIINA